MKRQAAVWEKRFANHTANKGSVAGIYKECSKFNSENKKSSWKMGKRHEETFHQRGRMGGK